MRIELNECQDGHFYWFEMYNRKRFPGQYVEISGRKAILGIRSVIWLDDGPHPIIAAIQYSPEREHIIHDFMMRHMNAEPLPGFAKPEPATKKRLPLTERKVKWLLFGISAPICAAIVVPLLAWVINPAIDHLFANEGVDHDTKLQALGVVAVACMALGIGAAMIAVDVAHYLIQKAFKCKD